MKGEEVKSIVLNQELYYTIIDPETCRKAVMDVHFNEQSFIFDT